MKKGNLKHFIFALAVVATAALTACGGGGGGGDSTVAANAGGAGSVTPVPAPSPVPVPAPLPSPVPAPAPVPAPVQAPAFTLQNPPVSSYLAGSPEKAMFDSLNQLRIGGGFGALVQSTAIDKAAKAHAEYIMSNFFSNGLNNAALDAILPDGTPSGHVETPSKLGFTGVNVTDRLLAGGYRAISSSEVIAFSVGTSAPGAEPPVSDCLSILVNTVFHRSALLSPIYKDVGFGVSNSQTDSNGYKLVTCVINFGSSVPFSALTSNFVGIYPFLGQTNVPLSMGGEVPDPAPEFTVKGSPVSIQGALPGSLTVNTFELRDANAVLVATKLVTRAQSSYAAINEAYLVPNGALKPNAVYFASFVGSIAHFEGSTSVSVPLSKSWSFTTGAK